MKKKLSTLLMFIFLCLSIFTGCNLWRSDGYANLNAIVATNGDISITREELITAYNNSGYYYDQYYGYTKKEAIEKTIESLISRQYLLNFIKDQAKTDKRLVLSKAEEYSVIKETWDYVDNTINSIVEQVRKQLGLTNKDLSTESEDSSSSSSEYKAKEVYKPKFVAIGDRVVRVFDNSNDDFVPGKLPEVYDYQLNLKSSKEDYKRAVWSRYITLLKKNQESYKYKDEEMTDEAVFHRELKKVYDTNYDNALLKKFESVYSNFGLDHDELEEYYYLNDKTLQDIIDKYKSIYNSNKELYNLSNKNSNIVSEEDVQNTFYKLLTTTSSREDYLYYGNPDEGEELLTCIHILIKFSEEQTNKIKEYDENPIYQRPYDEDSGISWADYEKAREKSADNTYGKYRTYDEEGNPTEGEEASVTQIYNEILSRINNEVVGVGALPGSDEYVEKVVKIFDEYIYTYNQDTGILNAKFDYIVGTKTSAMVQSFTEVVRKLHNEGNIDTRKTESDADYKENVKLIFPNGVGFKGAMSAPFLEEASNYSGYHIVLYTGTLKNIDANLLTVSNVFSKLGNSKTSYAYGQSIFEFIYDKVQKETYNSYQTNLVNSIMDKETKLNSSNYSDLLNG